jgi:carbon-monoxide dehydrogenase small subunit
MIGLTINGREVRSDADPTLRLLDFLREDLRLTGTKEGCGKGECGACSVLMDGRLVNSCLVLVGQCEGASITTIEGVGDGSLDPIQAAMTEVGAIQCGFCTPGLVLAATALLRGNRNPTPGEVRRAIEGNLCRCTGYVKVEAAILEAARRMGAT